jgi:hypothetical protein
MLAIGALAILVGVGAAMTSSGASLSRDEWIAGQARRVTHDWRRPQSPGITGHGSLFRHSVERVHEKVMMRALSIIGGSVFILLALPKAAGLFHALAVGSPTPTQFIVKQAVYTIALIGAGVAMFRAGRRSCEKPGCADHSRGMPTSYDCDRDRTGNMSDFDEFP